MKINNFSGLIPNFTGGIKRFGMLFPALDLDFAGNKTLDSRITFTRASTGTFYNASGVLVSAGNDVARFDHDPATGASLGLLVEEQRTNLLIRSEEFNDAIWTKIDLTVTANAIAAPDGTTTADTIIPSATSSVKRASQVINTTGISTFTFSVYAKAAGYNKVALVDPQHTASGSAVVDLTNGSQANIANTSGTTVATNVGNGWYRISWTLSTYPPAAVNYTFAVTPLPATGVTNSNSGVWTGDGVSGVYVWGAQVESAAFATSYIPTVAAQVTRNADNASMTGTNFSSWYRQDEWTLYIQATQRATSGTGAVVASFDDNVAGGNNSNIFCYFNNTANSPQFTTYGSTGTISEVINFNAATVTQGVSRKIVCARNAASVAIASAGSQLNINNTGVVPAPNVFGIGYAFPTIVNHMNGTIARITYYPARLTDPQLQALTS